MTKYHEIFTRSRDHQTHIMGLYDLIYYLNYHFDVSKASMAEIGVYAGQSTHIFSQYFKKVHAVDPWINDEEYLDDMKEVEKVFDTFKAKNVKKYKKTSIEAVKDIKDKSLDFVYIDARHELEYVLEDIDNWLPKLKDNGWIGGHDFYLHPVTEPWVANAVTQRFNIGDVVCFQDCSWLVKANNPPEKFTFKNYLPPPMDEMGPDGKWRGATEHILKGYYLPTKHFCRWPES